MCRKDLQAVLALHGAAAATAVRLDVTSAVAVFATLPLLHCFAKWQVLEMPRWPPFFSAQGPVQRSPGRVAKRPAARSGRVRAGVPGKLAQLVSRPAGNRMYIYERGDAAAPWVLAERHRLAAAPWVLAQRHLLSSGRGTSKTDQLMSEYQR